MSRTLEQTKIAKRYVSALFLGVEKKADMTLIANDMADLGRMIESSEDLRTFVKTPLLSEDQQKQGLAKLTQKAQLSDMVSNFLMVLVQNRRLSVLPAIVREVEAHMTKQSGTVPVCVATARKLTATDERQIAADIKAALGRDIIMQSYVDDSLIGGVVVQIESTLIDGSIKSKLDRLERDLIGNKAA